MDNQTEIKIKNEQFLMIQRSEKLKNYLQKNRKKNLEINEYKLFPRVKLFLEEPLSDKVLPIDLFNQIVGQSDKIFPDATKIELQYNFLQISAIFNNSAFFVQISAENLKKFIEVIFNSNLSQNYLFVSSLIIYNFLSDLNEVSEMTFLAKVLELDQITGIIWEKNNSWYFLTYFLQIFNYFQIRKFYSGDFGFNYQVLKVLNAQNISAIEFKSERIKIASTIISNRDEPELLLISKVIFYDAVKIFNDQEIVDDLFAISVIKLIGSSFIKIENSEEVVNFVTKELKMRNCLFYFKRSTVLRMDMIKFITNSLLEFKSIDEYKCWTEIYGDLYSNLITNCFDTFLKTKNEAILCLLALFSLSSSTLIELHVKNYHDLANCFLHLLQTEDLEIITTVFECLNFVFVKSENLCIAFKSENGLVNQIKYLCNGKSGKIAEMGFEILENYLKLK